MSNFALRSILVISILFNVHHSYGVKNPLPRFASIKSNEVNARSGPAIKYPIDWVFIKKLEPVEIVAEYEQWRLIHDISGDGGWVHLSVLSGKRYAIISSEENVPLKNSNDQESANIAILEPEVRCKLLKCKQDWCKLQCKESKGWIERKFIWGAYKNEDF